MFGNVRRYIAAAVSALTLPAIVTLIALSAAPARAGEIDNQLKKAEIVGSLFGAQPSELAQTSADLGDKLNDIAPLLQAISMEKVWAADYHPETDRWTERNNRVKFTVYGAGLFFGQNLRIYNDAGIGMRISWEVLGFIGIRLDSVFVPFSHMTVRNTGKAANTSTNRGMDGFVDCTSLSIAIFNPELSAAPNLAMWAGFGVDLWEYHYNEFIRTGGGTSRRYQYVDWNVGGNIFFNLEYKITDLFHVGFEIREHVVYAPQTERGQFYKADNLIQGVGIHTLGQAHSRNQDGLAEIPLSAVHEFQIHVALVF